MGGGSLAKELEKMGAHILAIKDMAGLCKPAAAQQLVKALKQEIGIPMPRMLDVDTKAERIVKEYIAGETVYTLVLKDALPETCLRQVQAMCRLLYPAHTNIDYFPTNFILQGDTLYYIDYECNDYMDEWNFENWGCKYWAKTPEFLQYAAEHP